MPTAGQGIGAFAATLSAPTGPGTKAYDEAFLRSAQADNYRASALSSYATANEAIRKTGQARDETARIELAVTHAMATGLPGWGIAKDDPDLSTYARLLAEGKAEQVKALVEARGAAQKQGFITQAGNILNPPSQSLADLLRDVQTARATDADASHGALALPAPHLPPPRQQPAAPRFLTPEEFAIYNENAHLAGLVPLERTAIADNVAYDKFGLTGAAPTPTPIGTSIIGENNARATQAQAAAHLDRVREGTERASAAAHYAAAGSSNASAARTRYETNNERNATGAYLRGDVGAGDAYAAGQGHFRPGTAAIPGPVLAMTPPGPAAPAAPGRPPGLNSLFPGLSGGPGHPAAASPVAPRYLAKPAPAPLVKAESDDIAKVQTARNVAADGRTLLQQLKDGGLNIGPVANAVNRGRIAIGQGTDESARLATFKSTRTRFVNDSLRLNTGVQTEGDAKRAAEEILSTDSDTKTTIAAIENLIRINERAARNVGERIDNRRSLNNLPPHPQFGADASPASVPPLPAGWSFK